jgi:hypothetical protein
MVTSARGPCRSAARACRSSQPFAALQFVDRGEDALGRGGGVELRQALAGRGGGDRLGQAEKTEMASIKGGSPTALERWIVASTFSPRSQILMSMCGGRSLAVGIL